MESIVFFLIVFILEIALSPTKKKRYQNIAAVATAAVTCILATVATLVITIFQFSVSYFDWIVLAVHACALLICKNHVKKKDAQDRHFIAPEYVTGRWSKWVLRFYKTLQHAPSLYLKDSMEFIGIGSLVAAGALYVFFVVQTFVTTSAVTVVPEAAGCLVSLLLEIGIFLSGPTEMNKEISRYVRFKRCRNARELAAARYAEVDDYDYLFHDNYAGEHSHIIKGTIQHYRPTPPRSGITHFDFQQKKTHTYIPTDTNVDLEAFIRSNGLDVNDLYCAAFNLIDQNQNVLLKTPSYVDFEPYLAAIIKEKVAKTEKIVFIVNTVDNQQPTLDMLHRAYTDYFGFDAVPLFKTLDRWYCDHVESQKKADTSSDQMRHVMSEEDLEKATTRTVPDKEPDVVIASPDDIFDPLYIPMVRKIASRLGMIVYYDFSDCVQEQPLFAKIVHSVLDAEDQVSTLYMTDGFCDLEQTMDNFFSTRTIYQISVPRPVPETSYDMVWKDENSRETQKREITDPSRNFGTHLTMLYYALGFVNNDVMMITDEHDAYADNILNFHDEKILSRIDHHVGWSNVIGGESVLCTVSDTYNNIPHTYLSLRGIGRKSEYINIISRPYLLRKYLAYNLKHFSVEPDALTNFSTGIIKTPRAIATEVVAQAHILGCKTQKIYQYAQKLKLDLSGTAEELLLELCRIAYDDTLEVAVTTDEENRLYIDKDAYVTIMKKCDFINKIRFMINGEIITRPLRDYRYLIPYQKIVLNGAKYTVLSVNGDQVELTNSNNRDPVFASRTVYTCEANVKKTESYGKLYQHGNDSQLDFTHMTCDATVNALGRISFTDSYSLLGETVNYTFKELGRIAPRNYKNVSVFKVRIGSVLITKDNQKELAKMLALLFKEMMPTFFPRHFEKIIIGCSGWGIDPALSGEQVSPMHIVSMMDVNDPEPVKENEICLYVMEDSSIETGIVNVFWQDEEFRYMLKILEDYLYHLEYVDRDERYVMFGDSYNDTLHTLRKLLLLVINEQSDGDASHTCINSIRSTRNKFNRLDLMKNFSLKCDFCGKTIPYAQQMRNTYHFYHYSGMVSCPSCYQTAVCTENKSYGEIGAYEGYIRRWLQKKYRVTINRPFYNYLEDAELIAKQTVYANRFLSTDDVEAFYIDGISCDTDRFEYPQRTFANGERYAPNSEHIETVVMDNAGGPHEQYDVERAAYWMLDRSNRFILIRDGLPQSRYLGVLTHEMTHQWQFEYLSRALLEQNVPVPLSDEFGRPAPIQGFRSEGHAMWVEVKFLEMHNRRLAAKVKQSLQQRNDEYGFGYRWMCDLMKVGNEDPYSPSHKFDKQFMKQLRKFQLQKNSFGVMQLYFGNIPPDPAPEEASEETEEPMPEA